MRRIPKLSLPNLAIVALCAATLGGCSKAQEEYRSYCAVFNVNRQFDTPTTSQAQMNVKNVGKECGINMAPDDAAAQNSSIDQQPLHGRAFIENAANGSYTHIGYIPAPGYTGKDAMVATVSSTLRRMTVTFSIDVYQ